MPDEVKRIQRVTQEPGSKKNYSTLLTAAAEDHVKKHGKEKPKVHEKGYGATGWLDLAQIPVLGCRVKEEWVDRT